MRSVWKISTFPVPVWKTNELTIEYLTKWSDYPIKFSLSACCTFLIGRIFSQVLFGRQRGELWIRYWPGRCLTASQMRLRNGERRWQLWLHVTSDAFKLLIFAAQVSIRLFATVVPCILYHESSYIVCHFSL